MSTFNEVRVSSQCPFSISGLSQPDQLSIAPPIYQRLFTNPITYQQRNSWGPRTAGGVLSTNVVVNKKGDEVFKVTESTIIRFASANNEYVFEINLDGEQASFSSDTSDISRVSVLFEDITGGLVLDVNPPGKMIEGGADTLEVSVEKNTCNVSTKLKVLAPAPKKKAPVWRFPSSEPFSLLQNTSLYFEGDVYQQISGEYQKVEAIRSDHFGVFGGFYSLTGNPDQLYTPGMTTLKLMDGFGTAIAEVEFNYDVQSDEVTATVLSKTGFDVCDFRRVESFIVFPNTLCIGL